MNRQQNPNERKYLLCSASGNLVIGIVGLTFSVITSSQAILLDGLFNLTYFASGLFTLKVARLVTKEDDECFPVGYVFFEPLINGIKGVLVLGVSVMALAGALQALFSGGRSISAGMAIVYGVFAASACFLLAIITRIGANRTKSPLIDTDAENWIVNAAISSAVLFAFVGIFIIKDSRFSFFVPYVDPSLVLIVVLISISIPVRMAWQALMELLNRAPAQDVVRQVRRIIQNEVSSLPIEKLFVRVIQPGRTRMVLVHAVLPENFHINGLAELDDIRRRTITSLKKEHLATILDMVFTMDSKLAEPASPLLQVKSTDEQAG